MKLYVKTCKHVYDIVSKEYIKVYSVFVTVVRKETYKNESIEYIHPTNTYQVCITYTEMWETKRSGASL